MKLLKELRERSGLTLRQVEEATSISNAYLSQLENGKIKKPSAQCLYVLSKLYGIDMEILLVESGLVKAIETEPVIMKMSMDDRISTLESKVKSLELESTRDKTRFEDLVFK